MRKRILFYLTLLFITASFTSVKAQADNDIFGYYFIQGRVPAAFADIGEIHLAGDYGAQQNPPVHGLIRPKKGKDFPVNKPVLNGKNISFTTKTVGGVSYQFEGAFVKFPNNAARRETVLQGVLRKFRGKTKIAEASVKFRYEAGD